MKQFYILVNKLCDIYYFKSHKKLEEQATSLTRCIVDVLQNLNDRLEKLEEWANKKDFPDA